MCVCHGQHLERWNERPGEVIWNSQDGAERSRVPPASWGDKATLSPEGRESSPGQSVGKLAVKLETSRKWSRYTPQPAARGVDDTGDRRKQRKLSKQSSPDCIFWVFVSFIHRMERIIFAYLLQCTHVKNNETMFV